MEAVVSHRLVDWVSQIDDPYAPNGTRGVIRYANLGDRISTDESGDEPGVIYGVPEARFHDLEQQGAFYSKAELDAGTTLPGAPVEGSDSLRSATGDTVAFPQGGVEGRERPVSFDALTPMGLAEHFVNVDADESDIASFIKTHPHMADKAAQAYQFMAAAVAAKGYELSDEINEAVAKAKGTAAHGPEGSEGVPGTDEPESGATPGTGGGSSQDEGGDAEGYTEPAKKLADEHGIDIADVEGTGTDGKVTKPDVEKHIEENQS